MKPAQVHVIMVWDRDDDTVKLVRVYQDRDKALEEAREIVASYTNDKSLSFHKGSDGCWATADVDGRISIRVERVGSR